MVTRITLGAGLCAVGAPAPKAWANRSTSHNMTSSPRFFIGIDSLLSSTACQLTVKPATGAGPAGPCAALHPLPPSVPSLITPSREPHGSRHLADRDLPHGVIPRLTHRAAPGKAAFRPRPDVQAHT